MGIVATVIGLALAAIVQSVVLAHASVVGVKVDLVMLLVVAWSIRRGIAEGIFWAIVGGIAIDLLSTEPFGAAGLSLGVAAVLAGSIGPSLRRSSALLPLAITPVVSIVTTLVNAAILALVGWPIFWPLTVALVVLPAAVLNSLAMLAVYPLVASIEARFGAAEWPA